MRISTVLAFSILGVLLAGPVRAVDPSEHNDDALLLLRRLTLDLANRVPTAKELTPLILAPWVDDPIVTNLLDGPEFDTFIRRYHADLLWPQVEPLDLVSAGLNLLLPAGYYEGEGDPTRLFAIYPGLYRRGGIVPCADQPAVFDPETGEVVLEAWPDGTQRDGWVMIAPYWAPETEVKVCALEAQELAATPTGVPCDGPAGLASGLCGCGPGLRYCASFEVATRLVDSLREQFLRAMTRSVRTGDYFGALTDRFEEVNGPLVHYYTWLVKSAIDPVILESPIPANTLPTGVAFSDPEWRSIVRGSHHSGILTSLPFLLRFPTGRARAARFAEAFLCAPYQAPADLVLPSPSDSCSDEPDLRQRCGCNSCHARLEPEAAWWGRFTDSGAYYLNPFSFPEVRANCANCQAGDGGFCDTICTPFYVTTAGHEKEKAQLGKLKTLEWRSPDELARAESGPEGLVAASLASGQLESCAVRRVFERFHGREPSKTELETVIPDLVDAFTQAHDFKALVGAVVRLPSYREESP